MYRLPHAAEVKPSPRAYRERLISPAASQIFRETTKSKIHHTYCIVLEPSSKILSFWLNHWGKCIVVQQNVRDVAGENSVRTPRGRGLTSTAWGSRYMTSSDHLEHLWVDWACLRAPIFKNEIFL